MSKLILRDNDLENIDHLDKFGRYITLLDVRQNNFSTTQDYDKRYGLKDLKLVKYTVFDKTKSLTQSSSKLNDFGLAKMLFGLEPSQYATGNDTSLQVKVKDFSFCFDVTFDHQFVKCGVVSSNANARVKNSPVHFQFYVVITGC